jgi:conjugative relaxase-like TrwC/TraI family protein
MALMITMSKSAAAAQKYFAEHLGPSDYYLGQDGARPGVWFGEGAERLGLEGQVSAQDFIALASNQDPRTGERLSVRDVGNARPGYDFTFSPPKSVSALWARTGDERLVEAFRQSVLDTLREDIEPEMKTRLRRGGQDGDAVTGNLVAALFSHDTTRPLKEDGKPDPHLHIHAYIFNRTWAPHENRWQAAQLGDLHLDGRYFEAAFEARLGARLRQLGYAIERDGEGSWEVVGVPGPVLDKFSRRKFEVEAEARKRGVTDPAAKAQLASLTRQKKSGEALATQALHDYWISRLTGGEAQAMDHVYAQAQDGGGTNGRALVTAGQAVRHSLEHFFGPDGRDSAVSEKAVLEEALRYGAGAVLPADAREELGRHDLIRADLGGRTVCTTADVLAEEQALVKSAWSGRNACVPLAAGAPYVPGEGLSREQAGAVAQLLGSQDRVQMLLGKSGTGKTTTLKALDAALRDRGRQLVAFAPTARASRGVLRSKGFATADTVANLLDKPELQAAVRGNVILIDEAGLAGTRALRQVFALVEKQQEEGYDTRVLLVGDSRQHRGVPRGQVLHILQDQAGLTPARLSTIYRQKDSPGYLAAVEDLSEGRVGEGFDKLDALGFIREIENPADRYRALAKDYADTLAAGQSAMIVAPTHAEGDAVVSAVREELRGRGLIGAGDRRLVRYESKGLTEAQRKDAALFEAGDTIQWTQHAPGFKRGERVTVVGRQGGRVQVQNDAGQVKELPLALAGRFELYRTTAIDVAQDDRLRISRNGYTAGNHRLNNGDVITVGGFTPEGGIIDQRGWVIPASYGHLAHGVVTSHASQGMEANVVFVAQSGVSRGASSAQQFYVSAGRGEKALRLYTDDKEALRAAVARSEQARSAAEVWQASQRQRQAEQQTRRKAWWQRRRRGWMAATLREQAARKLREITEVLQRRPESRGRGHAQS